MTVFIRLQHTDTKEEALKAAISGQSDSVFRVDPSDFAHLPGSPFAYWLAASVREIFKRYGSFENHFRMAKGGMKTQADERFLRLWWEIEANKEGWVPLSKGGTFGTYYFDLHLVTDWEKGGKRPRAAYEHKAAGESWGGFGRNEAHYFRPGVTWPRRTNGLSFRLLPAGSIFGDKGPAAFVDGNNSQYLLCLSAIMNSKTFGYLIAAQLARTELAQSYEVGLIQQTPVPELSPADEALLAGLARRAWSLKRGLDTVVETSHAFTLPALLMPPGSAAVPPAPGGGAEQTLDAGGTPALPGASLAPSPLVGEGLAGVTLAERGAVWAAHVAAVERALAGLQRDIDEAAFRLYGIAGADRVAVEAFDARRPQAGAAPAEDDEDTDEAEPAADLPELAAQLVSWAVGVAFGRFDIRLATGARPLPPEPGPFDPLPARSPAMPPAGAEDFAAAPDGLLVDEDGHRLDIADRCFAVFQQVFGAAAAARWDEAGRLLGCADGDVRGWLRRDFFKWHLKRHSKSRRQAPVYWPLGVASGRFTVWLYYPRGTPDTLHRAISDLIDPAIRRQAARLDELRGAEARPKALAAQESFLAELRAFRDEVARVADLFAPDFDDGVILNFAPLYRLVPQHKGWAKDLKAAWDKLQAGAYPWARLSLRLWREATLEAAARDRSIAIAHDLEAVLWAEDQDGKWRPHPEQAARLDALKAAPCSRVLAEAVASLVAAPPQDTRRRAAAPTAAGPAPEAIEAVRRALAVAIDGLTLKELTTRTGLAEAECRRVLDMLSMLDDARREGTGRGARWYGV